MFGRFKNWTGTFTYGYLFTKIGINTFYKKHETSGSEKVPYFNKPILFAVNHIETGFSNSLEIAVKLLIIGP